MAEAEGPESHPGLPHGQQEPTQLLEPSLPPLRICTGRKLGSGVSAGNQTQGFQGGMEKIQRSEQQHSGLSHNLEWLYPKSKSKSQMEFEHRSSNSSYSILPIQFPVEAPSCRQWMKAQVLGFLPARQETLMDFQAPGFSKPSPSCGEHLQSESVDRIFLSPHFCFSSVQISLK